MRVHPLNSIFTAITLSLSPACSSGKIGVTGDSAAHSDDSKPLETGEGEGEGEGEGGLSALDQIAALGELDVIVIHSDTLRADHLPLYGYARETMPEVELIPHVIVRGLHAKAPWTLPSTASALLSRTPEHHKRVSIRVTSAADEGWVTFAEALQDAGYATGLFSGNQILAGDTMLTQGFDTVAEVEDIDDVENQTLAALSAQGQRWVNALPEGQPYVLWLQPMDVHPPYRPQKPWRGTWADYKSLPFDTEDGAIEQAEEFTSAYNAAATEAEREAMVANVRAVYDELVLQQDAALGELMAWLDKTGRADRTLVVLTADHGETIGDDGFGTLSHMNSVRPELVQIPLAFFHPALKAAQVTCLSDNTDLGPTLMRALGLPDLEGADGQALQGGCRDHVISSLYENDLEEPQLTKVMISDGAWRLDWSCADGIASTYYLPDDPSALSPIPPLKSEEALLLQKVLLRWYDEATASLGDLGCRTPEI